MLCLSPPCDLARCFTASGHFSFKDYFSFLRISSHAQFELFRFGTKILSDLQGAGLMREINSHKVNPVNDTIKISVVDDPGAGGANHHYMVTLPDWTRAPDGADAKGVWDIQFQNGPISENGVNGITQEVLLAIVIDRLQSFQKGPFACRENALALTKLEEAKHWLFSRTLERMQRGVEGTHKK